MHTHTQVSRRQEGNKRDLQLRCGHRLVRQAQNNHPPLELTTEISDLQRRREIGSCSNDWRSSEHARTTLLPHTNDTLGNIFQKQSFWHARCGASAGRGPAGVRDRVVGDLRRHSGSFGSSTGSAAYTARYGEQWAEIDLLFQNKISQPGIDRFGRFFF